jgi:3-oxoacyl-[acyl-carrier protein] reductase
VLKIDLSGRVALVTGASGQLGRVIAPTLADCGADVAVHYHKNREGAEKLALAIRAKGRRAFAFKADITKAAAVQSLRKAVEKKLGGVDVVVANAVSQISWLSVLEQDPKDYEDQFRSNILQNVLLAKAFAPGMKAKRWGRFIAINTECAMQCTPGQSAYASAKRGLDGLYKVLARELGPWQITVNQVAPGWTISDNHRQKKQDDKGYLKSVPLGRRGEDKDIAQAVAFLASDLAGFIHGVYLPVCGGNVMTGL